MFINKLTKTLIIYGIISLSIIFMELVFRLSALELPVGFGFSRVILFSLAYASFIVLFLKIFSPVIAKTVFTFIMLCLSVFYFSQHLYHNVVEGFFSLNLLSNAGQGAGFVTTIIANFNWVHVLYFIPLIVAFVILFSRRSVKMLFDFRYENYRVPIYMTLFAFLLMFISIQSISTTPISEENDPYYSDQDFYDQNFSPFLSINRFGLLTYARRDLQNLYAEPTDEDMEDTNEIDEFFNNRPEHEANDMSDLFEGKNLIFIKAESLDTYGVDPDLMPNYYEMLENSMVFDNFYAPLYYRNTSDSEFMTHTSFYPSASVNMSMEAYKDNHFPNTLPNLFGELGYNTSAHHNYDDFYYPRSEFHPNTLGFDTYKGAKDMDLVPEGWDGEEKLPWLSDLEMFENTLDDVLSDEQFFAYYLTVTGHLPYDDTHQYAEKHYDTIVEIFEENDRDLPENEELIYFHAAHYEFDLAIGYLMDKLEDEGLKDDTVIMVASDHFAYGISRDVIADYDTAKNMDETRLNVHNVPMNIYHPSLENEHIEDVMSNIDVVPTLSNLFGLDMDYRKAFGYDVFSPNSENTVFFQDTSLLTDDYFMAVNEDMNVVKRRGDIEGQVVDDHYSYLIRKREINQYILENDYFRNNDDD